MEPHAIGSNFSSFIAIVFEICRTGALHAFFHVLTFCIPFVFFFIGILASDLSNNISNMSNYNEHCCSSASLVVMSRIGTFKAQLILGIVIDV